ncbi:MAG: WcaI family glycosyltransferase [Bacteroidota bacterium]
MGREKKRILVIGINSLPELTGIGRYTGDMITWLVDQGHEVTMITSFPYYPQWKVQSPYSGNFYKKEITNDGKLTLYRCPMYVPAKPTGIKRLIHEASFFLSAFFVLIRLVFKQRFDLTVCIAPPFHLGFLALTYRLFKRAPVVYHIQDLQIDAAKELKMLPDGIFSILFAFERFILRKVDLVSTISEGMLEKVKIKTDNSLIFFPNWVSTELYFPLNDRHLLKTKWGFDKDDKVVLYSGSIGEKQGLDSLIRIAGQLKTQSFIKFVICGTGPFKETLMKMAEAEGLRNVLFFPLQPNELFNEFLNVADVHLVLQKGDASDLVMPSKLTTILSVGGLALVTANPGTTLFEVIQEHQMGIVIKPEDEELLKSTILDCCTTDYAGKQGNARMYAERFLAKEEIMKDFESQLLELKI